MIANEKQEYFEEYLILKEAVSIILKLMQGIFDFKKDKLMYVFHENRPFHRAYYLFGLSLYKMNRVKEAIEVFENLIQINYNDNMGARFSLLKFYFEAEQYQKAIDLCENYSDDSTVDIVFGKVLAKAFLDSDDFEKEFRSATKSSPEIGKEIIKLINKSSSPNKTIKPNALTIVVSTESNDYLDNFGSYWLKAMKLKEKIKLN